jgi:hypothetical protein
MNAITLKRVLFLDAASCVGMGVLIAAASAPLAAPLGIAAPILFGAGLFLLPVALFIAFVAGRPVLRPGLVWLVVAGNLLWVAESFVLMATTPSITMLGQAFVAVQAVMVAGLSLLEAMGALRIRRARA